MANKIFCCFYSKVRILIDQHWHIQKNTDSKLNKLQGPKLTFLCRRQLATDFFFQSPDGKVWSPKTVNIFFPSQQNTDGWKILVANFSFENQYEEIAFGAAMAIVQLTNESIDGHIRSFVRLPNVSS